MALPPLLFISSFPLAAKAVAVLGRPCISLTQAGFGVSLPVSRSLVLAKKKSFRYFGSCLRRSCCLLETFGAGRVGAWEQQARFEA